MIDWTADWLSRGMASLGQADALRGARWPLLKRPSAAPSAGRIQRLTPDDAESLCPLSIEAGWNQVAADWRLMLGLGRGFGVRGETGNGSRARWRCRSARGSPGSAWCW